MKKIAFCLVMLGLSTLTFVGCAEKAKKPATPPAAAGDTKADEGTTPAADAPAADAPVAPSTDPPAEPAK